MKKWKEKKRKRRKEEENGGVDQRIKGKLP